MSLEKKLTIFYATVGLTTTLGIEAVAYNMFADGHTRAGITYGLIGASVATMLTALYISAGKNYSRRSNDEETGGFEVPTEIIRALATKKKK